MIETCELLSIGAVVEVVGNSQGLLGIVELALCTVAPSEGGLDHSCNRRRCYWVEKAVVRCPSIVNDAYSPEVMMCVTPPSEDD